MKRRVLHLLSQRPSLTGSGVTLDALVRHAALAGWEQRVLAGTPASDPTPQVGGLPSADISTVPFGGEALPFPVPGMSDLMPYDSTVFSTLDAGQVEAYLDAWRDGIRTAAEGFEPDVVHSHHLWLMTSVVKEVLPDVPVVAHCHATGLRQMQLCPHLGELVRQGCRRVDRFAVLTVDHREALARALGVAEDRVGVVGAGYEGEIFHARGRARRSRGALLFAGKLARSKGLPWLLDAVAIVARRRPEVCLHVAGGGSGAEADALRERMDAMGDRVRFHGRLDQPALAELMRRCEVFVLPSFYEGLPLVLVEAAACGCRSVATRLDGVEGELAPHLGPWLALVDMPRLEGPDEPVDEDLPGFVRDLADALEANLARPPEESRPAAVDRFAWVGVFERVEQLWLSSKT